MNKHNTFSLGVYVYWRDYSVQEVKKMMRRIKEFEKLAQTHIYIALNPSIEIINRDI